MHEKLSHLTSEEVEELISGYYGGKKNSELISEYKIDIHPNSLFSLFPPIVHKDLECPYCENENMISKRESKSGSRWSKSEPYCPSCNHKDSSNCCCEICTENRNDIVQNKEQQKRYIIEERYYNNNMCCPELDELTLRDAVYLLSLFRHSVSEDYKFAEPFSQKNGLLAPEYDFQNIIVQHLYSKEFIAISSESDTESIVFNDAITATKAYYPAHVKWEFLPGKSKEDKKSYISWLGKAC